MTNATTKPKLIDIYFLGDSYNVVLLKDIINGGYIVHLNDRDTKAQYSFNMTTSEFLQFYELLESTREKIIEEK